MKDEVQEKWNIGIMERWNGGKRRKRSKTGNRRPETEKR